VRDIIDVSAIPGWFSKTDQKMFAVSLLNQSIKGDLLEIGVYLGKSSVLLESFRKNDEKLVVCDLFENEVLDPENRVEIHRSYKSLSLENFTRNFLKYHTNLPVIHNGNSSELPRLFSDSLWRFVHVDGSHLYEYVQKDIAFAASHIEKSQGIIVLDDYRAPHTPGVSAAMWDALSKGELQILALSGYKAYLMHRDNRLDLNTIYRKFAEQGLKLETFKYFNKESVRIVSNYEYDFPGRYPNLKKLIPPILISGITRLRTSIPK
jgi:hypothetical protein